MKKPLVTVVVTTRNNTATIKDCLESIASQSYTSIELIVVDNNSKDDTKDIAKNYTKLVFTKGPERSAQRNYAVQKSTGEYILIIDSDMVLAAGVVEDCVDHIQKNPQEKALIIPETSTGEGFWAKCKALERSFYIGQDWIEAPRFVDKDIYLKVGGYDETMTGGEDWDFCQRLKKETAVGRISQMIYHNEGKLEYFSALKKRAYYTKGFIQYFERHKESHGGTSVSVLRYYKLYLSKPGKLLRNPLVGIGMLFLKTSEFGANAVGLLMAKLDK